MIDVYDFGGLKVRTAGTLERPLFCAADVCEVLDISNARDAVSRLPQGDVETVGITDAQGKTRGASFLTEGGLYKLVMRSRKPKAEAFTDWVTSEVLPAIRRKGYYSAIEAEQEKLTEKLLAECFPKLPGPSVPIFRDLIAALVRIRRESESGNPPWARTLARLVYAWAIHIEGEQLKRRELNPKPCGSRTDHSMFSEPATEAVKRVVQTGTDFARISTNWDDWKLKMELAFGKRAVQLPILVSISQLPDKSEPAAE